MGIEEVRQHELMPLQRNQTSRFLGVVLLE
jgi:hypothetical protein